MTRCRIDPRCNLDPAISCGHLTWLIRSGAYPRDRRVVPESESHLRRGSLRSCDPDAVPHIKRAWIESDRCPEGVLCKDTVLYVWGSCESSSGAAIRGGAIHD